MLTHQSDDSGNMADKDRISNFTIPKEVEVFEISGPLFFGAAYKFKDSIKFIEDKPKVLIIRMRYVPIIDATGINSIKDVYKETKQMGIKLVLSEVKGEKVLDELRKARLVFAIGKANVTDTFEQALERSKEVIRDGMLK